MGMRIKPCHVLFRHYESVLTVALLLHASCILNLDPELEWATDWS